MHRQPRKRKERARKRKSRLGARGCTLRLFILVPLLVYLFVKGQPYVLELLKEEKRKTGLSNDCYSRNSPCCFCCGSCLVHEYYPIVVHRLSVHTEREHSPNQRRSVLPRRGGLQWYAVDLCLWQRGRGGVQLWRRELHRGTDREENFPPRNMHGSRVQQFVSDRFGLLVVAGATNCNAHESDRE